MGPMDDVARELGQLFRSLKTLHPAVLAASGLRLELPALALLTTLDDRGRLRSSALAELLHVDLSVVSRQVAAAEREGWVSRTRDPADSRASLLEITDEGRSVLTAFRRARVDQLRGLLPHWSDDDLTTFAGWLARFRDDLLHPDQPHPDHTRTPALAGQESR